MRTDDGWTVEAVNMDGEHWYRVKRYGSLALVGVAARRRGLVRTIDEVRALLGPSFDTLK